MFRFLSAVFGGPGRRPITRQQARQALSVRLGLNELSQKIVPNACSGGAASHTAFARDDNTIAAMTSRQSSTDSGDAGQSEHQCGAARHATLAANLSNESGETATATLNTKTGELKVTVTGGAPSSPLDVSVNGTSVGTLTTNENGSGTIKLKDVTAAAGDTIQIGDLTGTLTQSRLSATLSGSTDAEGKASVNVIKNHLRIRIRGAEANTTYDVSIDGTTVGQITTNGRGSGRLFVSPTAAIVAGSTISILDSAAGTTLLSGTFA
jgi:hypothetical protein